VGVLDPCEQRDIADQVKIPGRRNPNEDILLMEGEYQPQANNRLPTHK
jgi:hypothetical protein